MELFAYVMSVAIAVIGMGGVLFPERLVAMAQQFQSPGGFYAAVAVRLLYGASLYVTAPVTDSPQFIRVLGGIVFAAGVVLLVLGQARLSAWIDWWISRGTGTTRTWAAAAAVFGVIVAMEIR